MTSRLPARRRAVHAILAIVGIAYALFATHWYIANAMALVPWMNSMPGTLAFRIFWFGIELWPVTIVVTAFRLGVVRSIIVVVSYLVLMEASVFVFSPFDIGEAIGLIVEFGFNLALQVPVWLATWLVMKFAMPPRSTTATDP